MDWLEWSTSSQLIDVELRRVDRPEPESIKGPEPVSLDQMSDRWTFEGGQLPPGSEYQVRGRSEQGEVLSNRIRIPYPARSRWAWFHDFWRRLGQCWMLWGPCALCSRLGLSCGPLSTICGPGCLRGLLSLLGLVLLASLLSMCDPVQRVVGGPMDRWRWITGDPGTTTGNDPDPEPPPPQPPQPPQPPEYERPVWQ